MDTYIESADPSVQPRLEQIRRLVHECVGDADECISYQMPAFRRGRIFLYFGAFTHHVGLYPPVAGDPALEADLAPWRGPKGNLVFLHKQPLPMDVLRRVVESLAGQYGGKGPTKT